MYCNSKKNVLFVLFVLSALLLTSCAQEGLLKNSLNINETSTRHSDVDGEVDYKKIECDGFVGACLPLERFVDIRDEPWRTITKLRDTVDPRINILIHLRNDSSMVAALSHTIVIDQGALEVYGARGLVGAVAHELGHIALRHKNKRDYYQKMLKAAVSGASLINDDIAFRTFVISRVTDSIVTATWKKEQELEADRKAVEILAQAGIDPKSVIFAFTKKAGQLEALIEKRQTSLERFLKQVVSGENNGEGRGHKIKMGVGLDRDEVRVYSKLLHKLNNSNSDPVQNKLLIATVEGLNRVLVDLSDADHPTIKERNRVILKKVGEYKGLKGLKRFDPKVSLVISGFCLNRGFFLKNESKCFKYILKAADDDPVYYYVLVKMLSGGIKTHYQNKIVEWLEKSLKSDLTPDSAWEMLADIYFRLGRYDSVVKLKEGYNKLHGENNNIPYHLLLASLAAEKKIGKTSMPLVCIEFSASKLSVSAYNKCVAASNGEYQPQY